MRVGCVVTLLAVVFCVTSLRATAKPGPENLRHRRLGVSATLLDEYVAKVDDSFNWQIVARRRGDDAEHIVVRLTSQTWQPGDVKPGAWEHWLVVYVPDAAHSHMGMLFVSGGRRDEPQPETPNPLLAAVARETESIVAELRCVPNQPLEFAGDGVERYEDNLLAESWKTALAEEDTTWLGQLPMAKAAVRAMDALEQLTASDDSLPNLSRFVVSGASKRGWTTWLAAAVDTRVEAIIPIVIDVLNIRPSLNHHLKVYGEWSPALADYAERGFDLRINDPKFDPLLELVDPYSYRDRLDLPKCIINASGDEFFLPDSSQFYFDELPGEKHLAYVPNAGHSLNGSKATDTLIGFYSYVLASKDRPRVQWTTNGELGRVLTCDRVPNKVQLWYASNPKNRDFRLATLGPGFVSHELISTDDGEYLVDISDLPADEWIAYFAQAEFDSPSGHPLRLTTPVWVRNAD